MLPLSLPLTLANESVHLLPDRALFWPGQNLLVVADVNLGKMAAPRRTGAAPASTPQADLARLTVLLTQTKAKRLLVLGDLFHLAPAQIEPLIALFHVFRGRHPSVKFSVIRTNHEGDLQRFPTGWKMEWIADALHQPPFVFQHKPLADARGYALGGQLQPCIALGGRSEAARVPAFWFAATVGVLPGFSGASSGHIVRPKPGEQCIAVTPDGLVKITE